MKIGDVIASIRRRKGIDQKVLADKLEVSVSYMSHIERNKKLPSSKLLKKIADELGVPLSALLFEVIDESTMPDDNSREVFRMAKPIMDKMLAILLDEEPQPEEVA